MMVDVSGVGEALEGSPNEPVAAAVPSLVVSGLIVTKADLLGALRPYVPQVVDIAPLDGERFSLTIGDTGPVAGGDGGL